MAIDSNEPLSETGELSLDSADPAVSAGETNNADPITGEPGAHPAAVGFGAIAAGAAGAAAIGAFAGPIGAIIGAAIGAVAGGLAGHEVAAANDDATEVPTGDLNAEANGSTTDESGRPSSVAVAPEENLTVFPGLDMGSPAVGLERQDAGEMAMSAFAPEAEPTPKDHEAAAATDEPEDFAVGGESASPFAIGADPHETIRVAAYYHYLDRRSAGRPDDALADWYEAEREVLSF